MILKEIKRIGLKEIKNSKDYFFGVFIIIVINILLQINNLDFVVLQL